MPCLQISLDCSRIDCYLSFGWGLLIKILGYSFGSFRKQRQ